MKNRFFHVFNQIDRRIKLLVLTALIAICILFAFVVRNSDIPSDWDSVEITPVTFPAFIQQVYPNPGNNHSILNMVCITIDVLSIWERGDTSKEIENRVDETLQIEFDNAPITRKSLFELRSLVSRADGVVLGSIPTCEPVQVTGGQHTVSVNWISTAKKNFSYTWSFRTEAVQSIDPGDRNLNLLVYYDYWRGKLMDHLG